MKDEKNDLGAQSATEDVTAEPVAAAQLSHGAAIERGDKPNPYPCDCGHPTTNHMGDGCCAAACRCGKRYDFYGEELLELARAVLADKSARQWHIAAAKAIEKAEGRQIGSVSVSPQR